MCEGRSYQRKKTLLRPKIEWRINLEREKSFWGEVKGQKLSRETGERERKIALRLYIEITILDGLKAIERCRELILDRWICQGAIKRCPQQSDLDGSRSYQVSIEQTETLSIDREVVEKVSRQILKNFDGSKL